MENIIFKELVVTKYRCGCEINSWVRYYVIDDGKLTIQVALAGTLPNHDGTVYQESCVLCHRCRIIGGNIAF